MYIKLVTLLFSAFLAAIVGVTLWLFLCLSKLVVTIAWHNHITTVLFFVLLPIVFGVIIGMFEKKYGVYPKNPDVIVKDYLKDNKREYDHPVTTLVGSLLPIMGGGSVGPESSLISIVVPLSVRFGDMIRSFMGKHGLDIEKENIPKDLKLIQRIKYNPFKSFRIALMNIVGLLVLIYLTTHDRFEPLFTTIGDVFFTKKELFFILPLILLGFVVAALYLYFGVLASKVSKLFGDHIIIRSTMVGVVLSLTFIVAPISLFSGEHNIKVITEDWPQYVGITLIVLGIWKLFLTQLCLKNGWRGGHGFPIIFSGTCIGFAISLIFGVNATVAVAIITSISIGLIYNPVVAIIIMPLILVPSEIFIGIFVMTLITGKLFSKSFTIDH